MYLKILVTSYTLRWVKKCVVCVPRKESVFFNAYHCIFNLVPWLYSSSSPRGVGSDEYIHDSGDRVFNCEHLWILCVVLAGHHTDVDVDANHGVGWCFSSLLWSFVMANLCSCKFKVDAKWFIYNKTKLLKIIVVKFCVWWMMDKLCVLFLCLCICDERI